MTGESIGYGLSKLMEMLGLKSVLGNMDLTGLLGSLSETMTTIGKVSGLIGNTVKLSIGVVTDRRLIESTMSLISEVIPLLRENIPRFIPLISMMMPTAIGAMPALLSFAVKKVGEVMDAGIGGLLKSLPSLIQATISATAAVIPMLTSILSDILKNETLRESIVSLLSGVINLLRGLLEGLRPTLEIFNLA